MRTGLPGMTPAIAHRVAAGLLVLSLLGCASTTAPPGYVDGPVAARQSAYGGWVTVTYELGPEERVPERERLGIVHGELLAVTPDSVFVLRPAGNPGGFPSAGTVYREPAGRTVARDSVFVLGRSRIDRLKLTGYVTSYSEMALWTTLGTLSTLSHGWLLGLSAPVWIIAGTAETAAYSRAGERKAPPGAWSMLGPFARYPQGWPPGLDRRSVRARRY